MKFLTLLLCFGIALTSYGRGKIKVACVGNSITYGMTLQNREAEAYPSQLQEMLGDDYEVGNFGKSGATLLAHGHRPYIEQEEYKQALAFAGDIVVIHLGVNDTDPRNWPNYRDAFVSDYLNLIDSFKKVNPNCRVIVARLTPIGITHPRFESGTRDWRDLIQTEIEQVARAAGAQLIDFESPLYARPELIPDALHPNAEGAKILAQTVFSAITGKFGGLKMSRLYADHMVLQRNRPLTIGGTADAGAEVVVTIDSQRMTAKTGSDGKWSVTLLPLPTGGPYTLTVSDGQTQLRYSDVMAGEVWLCSGQSNMEFKMKAALTGKADIPASACSYIRLFNMQARWRTDAIAWSEAALDSVNKLEYLRDNGWETATPQSVADFSAVAYYFGKALKDSLGVPIGLICNAVGGSPAESWIDRRTLEHQFPKILQSWKTNDLIQDWVRKRVSENIEKASADTQRHPYEPCYLFESGILPLSDYTINGVIWYQGESNAHNMEAHEKLFPLLVGSWRNCWKNPNLPFYYVQLSSMYRPSWCWFRDSQRRMMQQIPGTGMAVCSDVGDSLDVHPRDKKSVGQRLARWALHQTYGKSHVVPSGPIFREADFGADAVTLTFDYGEGMRSSDGKELRTFELAGADGIFHPAEAKVENGRVKVSSAEVNEPCQVRYGWQPFTRANLVNGEGLPASTFRAEAKRNTCEAKLTEMKGVAADKKYSKGVSAAFAGYTDGCAVVAGGCNFPDKPAAEGGKKVYYDKVYIMEETSDSTLLWKSVGRLEQPIAYGAAISTSRGIVCAGGMNSEGPTKEVFLLNVKNRKAVTTQLPELPFTLDNMAGTAIGSAVYIVGGNRDGVPSNTLLCLDLEHLSDGWKELAPFPGSPRTQPVCAAQYDSHGKPSLFLWGGFAAASERREATLRTDGLEYSPDTGVWRSLPSATDAEGEDVSLGGGVAIPVSDSLIVCMGGVNKDIFLEALRNQAPDYMSHPSEWYKFNDRVMLYNTRNGEWETLTRTPLTARAGAVVVSAPEGIYNINGELKPGVRSPQVTKLRTIR